MSLPPFLGGFLWKSKKFLKVEKVWKYDRGFFRENETFSSAWKPSLQNWEVVKMVVEADPLVV